MRLHCNAHILFLSLSNLNIFLSTAVEERIVEGEVWERFLENGEKLVELDRQRQELDSAQLFEEVSVQV